MVRPVVCEPRTNQRIRIDPVDNRTSAEPYEAEVRAKSRFPEVLRKKLQGRIRSDAGGNAYPLPSSRLVSRPPEDARINAHQAVIAGSMAGSW